MTTSGRWPARWRISRRASRRCGRQEQPGERAGLVGSLDSLYRWATPDLSVPSAPPDAEEPAAGATAREWVQHHGATLEEAVTNRLCELPVEPGHPRLRWSADGGRFFARVLIEVRTLAGGDTWAGVRRAIVPAELHDVVDGARVLDGADGPERRSRGTLDWYPEVAIAIADVLGRRVVDSLARLSARYVAISDERERRYPEWPAGMRQPEAGDLVPAHPVDRAVIAALCDGLVAVGPGPAVGGTGERNVELGAASKLRRIQRYEWQVARGAWTWLRVHEPADASLEEVAATLLGQPDAAYRMSASPPLFGFLPDDAARIPGARSGLPMGESAEETTTLLGLMRPVDAALGGAPTSPGACDVIALVPSIVVAGAVAWWITRREGWPVMAALLQLSFHFLWAAILWPISSSQMT